MNCTELIQDLYLLVDGELPSKKYDVLKAHMNECADCLERFGIEREFKLLLKRKCADSPPSELIIQIKATLEHEAGL